MTVKNSHIQLPKSILKNFSHKTKDGYKVYYLDLKDNEVKEEKIKLLGTEEYYFSDEVETFLSENIESCIGEVSKRLKVFIKGRCGEMSISSVEEEHIKRYLKYSMIRTNRVIDIANASSVLSEYIGNYSANDMLSFVDFNKVPNPFSEFRVDIFENRTKTDFVVPRNGFYSMIVEGKQTKYIMPIAPKVAFVLLKQDDYENNTIHNKHHYMAVEKDEIVKSMNLRANYDERFFNNDFVVAYRKDELLELQDYNRKNV